MNHQALVRPNMPGSTPAPAPQGMSSVYGSRMPPHFTHGSKGEGGGNGQHGGYNHQQSSPTTADFQNDSPVRQGSPSDQKRTEYYSTNKSQTTRELIRSSSAKMRQRVLQEKTLTKIVSKLPYELRETVTAVLTMAFSTSENAQKDLDVSNQESLVLKSELGKKIQEIHTLQKSVEIYKAQIKGYEESVATLKDNIDSRQKFSLKHRSAMTRLATTNRMLIDALDALQANGTAPGQLSKGLSNLSSLEELPPPGRPGQLAPIQATMGKGPKDHKEYEDKANKLATSQNDKLRESLLKIAREHYRSMKNVEHLENKVSELKLSLRAQEQINRNFKTELEELKALHQADAQAMEDNKSTIDLPNMQFKEKTFGYLDDRFKALIDRNLFDPIDGIQQLRRILAHMATAPTTLNLPEMIGHIVSKDTVRIFDSDMICLYLVKPGTENILHKFTTRSAMPVTIDMDSTKSMAGDTIKTGKVCRLNNLSKNSSYNVEIDGCTGVLNKRIMSLPLINTRHSMVIGAIQFINKGTNNDVFAEIDEIFGLIFAYQSSLLVTSCVMYDALFYHSQLLRGLLEASTDLYSIIPEPGSLAYSKSLSPSEVILVLERTARDLLKCPNVRAFLVSDSFENMPSGHFLFIDPKASINHNKITPNAPIVTAPSHSGVVGHVLATKKAYLTDQSGLDTFLNPIIDLEPLTYSMLTVPIMDLHGTVIAILQLLVGNRSPRLKETDDPNDFRLFFGQAAEWLGHQLASPLRYLLDYIGRPVHRPVSTPSRLTRSSQDREHRPSFFSSSEEVVNQMLLVNERYNDAIGTDSAKSQPPPATKEADDEDSFKAIPLKDFMPTASETFQIHRSSNNLPNGEDGQGSDSRKTVRFNEHKSNEPKGVDLVVHETLQKQYKELEGESAILKQQVEEKQREFEALTEELYSQRQANDDLIKRLNNMEQLHEEQENAQAKLEQDNFLLQEDIEKLKNIITKKEVDEKKLKDTLHHKASSSSEQDQYIAGLQAKLNTHEDESQKLRYQLTESNTSISHLEESTKKLQTENKHLQGQHELLSKELKVMASEKTDLSHKVTDLQKTIEDLQKKLAEKDKVQAILQEQVVKLANQNIKSLDHAITKAQDNTATETPTRPPATFASPAVSASTQESTTHKPAASESKQPAVESKAATKIESAAVVVETPPSSATAAVSEDNIAASTTSATTEEIAPPPATGETKDDLPINTTPLPPGWAEMTDSYGRVYYYNNDSGESSWEDPRNRPSSSSVKKLVRGDWMQQFDENGQEYWVNSITGASAWEVPENELQTGYNDDVDEEDLASANRKLRSAGNSNSMMFESSASQYSISAGDYTIEL